MKSRLDARFPVAGSRLLIPPPQVPFLHFCHAAAPRAQRFGQALRFVAWLAEALLVRVIVKPAFSERDHVITLRCEGDEAKLRALGTQRLTHEQRSAPRLKTTPRDALGCSRLLAPWIALVVSASARRGCQGSAAWKAAWTRGCCWHGLDLDAEHTMQTKKPSIAEGSCLSFTGTAASVMDGRPLCLCSVVGTDYMFEVFSDVNNHSSRTTIDQHLPAIAQQRSQASH